MSSDVSDYYLREVRHRFSLEKQLADRALAQVAGPALSTSLSGDANTLGMLMKHVGGNLRARWTDVFANDGEAGRDRDAEFEHAADDSPETFRRVWEEGWSAALAGLARLNPPDLLRHVTIRGESMLLIEALGRSLVHTAEHVGQIVLLARYFAGPNWTTLSVPRGESRTFTRTWPPPV